MVDLIYISVSLIFAMIYYKNKIKIRKYLNITQEPKPFYIMFALLIFSTTAIKLKLYMVIRGLTIAIVIFMLMIHFAKKSLKFRLNVVAGILLVFLGICLLSTIYSINRLETLVKVVELICDLFVLWLIFTYDTPKNATKNVFLIIISVYIMQLCMMIVGFFVAPNYFTVIGSKSVIGVQMGGGVLGANGTGVASLIPIIWCMNSPKSKLRNCIFILSIITLILAQSRTSMIILCVLLCINLFLTKNKFIYTILLSILGLVAIKNIDLLINYFNRGAVESNITSMSGRTTMWSLAKDYIAQKPLLGYGFGAGGYMVSSTHHNMSSLHNGVFEVLMGVGYIGLILISAAYIISAIQLGLNCLTRGLKNNSIEIMILILLTVRIYTSISIGGWHSTEMLVWYYLVFVISTIKNHKGIRYSIYNGK